MAQSEIFQPFGEEVAKAVLALCKRQVEKGRSLDNLNLDSIVAGVILENGLICVKDGNYSGKVLDVSPEGVVTQRVHRDGQVARHALSSLSKTVALGDVVDIAYSNGVGTVSGKGLSVGVGR